jgi:hypothetical protein
MWANRRWKLLLYPTEQFGNGVTFLICILEATSLNPSNYLDRGCKQLREMLG